MVYCVFIKGQGLEFGIFFRPTKMSHLFNFATCPWAAGSSALNKLKHLIEKFLQNYFIKNKIFVYSVWLTSNRFSTGHSFNFFLK